MANLGTASIPIIPSTTINIPKPGLLYTGASTNAGGANTTLTPEAVSPATTFNMVSVGDIVYNTTVSPNTIGVITGLNYTGSNITSVDTNITWCKWFLHWCDVFNKWFWNRSSYRCYCKW